MAQPGFSANAAQARALVQKSNLLLNQSQHAAAFALYLQAAELFSLVVRQAPDGPDKRKVKLEWMEVLRIAGDLKKIVKAQDGQGGVLANAGAGRLSEQDSPAFVLRFHACRLARPPPLDRAITNPLLEPDPFYPALPDYLQAIYASLPLHSTDSAWDDSLAAEDIEQDSVRDCSFISGVQATFARKQSRLFSSNLFPHDSSGSPTTAPNGQHLLRIFVNGAWRSLAFDAALPISTIDGTPVGVRLHGNSGDEMRRRRGVALIEKAWVKSMGGWDLAGSTSSVDLRRLTGWIPEVIGFRSSDFQREKTWVRIHAALAANQVIATLGTGKLSLAECDSTGLISSHDYAVKDFVERDGARLVRLINPWRRKKIETSCEVESDAASVASFEPGTLESAGWTDDLRDALLGVHRDGTLLLPWELVCATFDALHLNWDPTLYPHSQVVHSSWSEEPPEASAFPQFELRTTTTDEILLLLSRHLVVVSQGREVKPPDFISLQVFEDGVNSATSRGAASAATFTDCPHVLIRLKPASPDSVYTVIIPRDGPPRETRFSLFAYSTAPCTISDIPPPLPYRFACDGEFIGRSAGGNVNYSTFMSNPMFKLVIRSLSRSKVLRSSADVKITLTTKSGLSTNVKLVWGGGERVSNVVQGDIIADSGLYCSPVALCSKSDLAPGSYTLIVSAFEPRQEGAFSLAVESSLPLDLTAISQEGAGLFSKAARGTWNAATSFGAPKYGNYEKNPSFRVLVTNPCEMFFRLALSNPSSGPPKSLPLNLTLYRLDPLPPGAPSSSLSLENEVATTGAYSDAICGVSTAPLKLEKGDYRVVCSSYAPGTAGSFTVVGYATQAFSIEKFI